MSKYIKTGGQQLANMAPCGFISSGSPREARGKMKLHCKTCASCKARCCNGNTIDKAVEEHVGFNGCPTQGWKQTALAKLNL